ncbi:hypothetical protein [Streptomyces sp. NPDC088400]|jgi:hypothetical protein|uniref:hypothetical protein n=1 Tax=Streptomyces sp. NPDC088400 TaxID=3365861 RepID=UPI0037FA119E
MLGFAAAVLFAIAFIINASDTAVDTLFAPTSLMLLGLTLLALHMAGIGAGWAPRGRRR